MIDERMEEQASLHVLGVLTPEETPAFATALGRDVELRQLVETLRISRDALAGSLPQVTPSLALRQRVLEQAKAVEKTGRLPARTETRFADWSPWLPWALVACLAIVCAVSLSQQKTLRQKLGTQAKQLAELDQLADALRNETQGLSQAVAKLRETHPLQDVRIVMLSSPLEDSPKAEAVSLWDDKQQRGVLMVQNLKPLPADQDYQLWVMDPQYPAPVNAGVFQVDALGNTRLQFKADKPIEATSKFAVTQEPKGGLPTPTLKNLVLIGG